MRPEDDADAQLEVLEALADAGIVAPPLGAFDVRDVDVYERWSWGTMPAVSRLDEVDLYMFDVEAVLRSFIYEGRFFALCHAGHGMNSYAVNLVTARGPIGVFTQHGWGGVYMDPLQGRFRLNQTYSRLHALFSRIADPDAELRWVLLYSQLRGTIGVVDFVKYRETASFEDSYTSFAATDAGGSSGEVRLFDFLREQPGLLTTPFNHEYEWAFPPAFARAEATDRKAGNATVAPAAAADSASPHVDASTRSRQILEHEQSRTFAELFPEIGPSATLDALHLSVRVRNRLVRDGKTTFAGLGPYTVADVLEWSGVGIGSVLETLRALHRVAPRADGPDRTHGIAPDVDVTTANQQDNQVLEDVAVLAKWHRLLGADDVSVWVVPEGVTEPAEVVAARERLGQLAANSVLPAPSGNGSASDLVDQLLTGFEPRDLLILRGRVFAEAPAKLDALGADLGVTREYARQREAKAKSRLAKLIAEGDLAGLAAVARAAIVDIVPLRVLLQKYSSLAEMVDTLAAPVWRVLDRLDDSYEIRDGWAASPSVADAVVRTKALLTAQAAGRRYVEIAGLEDAPAGLTEEWLEYCEIKLLLGYALVGAAGIADRAEVVLAASETPLSSDDIHARIGVPRALNAVKNALAVDERFVRVGLQSWALKEWGMRGYQSIKKSIAQIVDASGDGVALTTLIDTITAQVDVSSNSITTYAAAHPFITKAGVVRRRTRREMRRPERRKGLAQTRNLYRLGNAVAYRVTVTGEHLRGSGTPLPNALGEELDLLQSERRELPVRGGGDVTLSWRGPQIAIGSMRSATQRLEVASGDVVFLLFHEDGSMEFAQMETLDDPLGQVAAMTGGPINGQVIQSLADRIDSEAASITELAHDFAARGEHQIADLLVRTEGAPAKPTV